MAATCVCGRPATNRLVYDKPCRRGITRVVSAPYCPRCTDARAFGALYSEGVRFINAPRVT